jgi:hypothetical protein
MSEKYLQANIHVALKMLKFVTEAKNITSNKIWLLYYMSSQIIVFGINSPQDDVYIEVL